MKKKNLNIYNNYFKAPWMPDRTEANPNELNQDDARYGFRCCHLKNIWTAPLPPETELSRQMTTSTTSIDIMGLQAAYAFFFQAEDGIRFWSVTGVQTCALPISAAAPDKTMQDRFYAIRDYHPFDKLAQADYNALTITHDSDASLIDITIFTNNAPPPVPAGDRKSVV